MDCREFEQCVEAAIVKGPGSDAARAHASSCESCGRLLDVIEGRVELLPTEDEHAFTRDVLNRTSGTAACADAGQMLCDYVDGQFGEADRALVRCHLERCEQCGRLAGALRMLQGVLPRMAEVEPGSGFTESVLRATSKAESPLRKRYRNRRSAWWHRLTQRPAFPWEAAYAGCLLIIAIFGNPAVPFLEGSGQIAPYAHRVYGGVMERATVVAGGVPFVESHAALAGLRDTISEGRQLLIWSSEKVERAAQVMVGAASGRLGEAASALREGAEQTASTWKRRATALLDGLSGRRGPAAAEPAQGS
jgi:anti-sigma factor RsiW